MKIYFSLFIFSAALIASLLPGNAFTSDLRSLNALWENGHVLLFFLGCYLFYSLHPEFADNPLGRQTRCLLGVTLCCAVALETAQSFISSKPLSLHDIAGDLGGTLLFLSIRHRKQWKNAVLLHVVTVLFMGAVFWPACRSIGDEIIARYQFPLLTDFETPFEASRFEGKTAGMLLSSEQAFHGKRSLKLLLRQGPWSGVMLRHLPTDWQGYYFLCFAVYNAGQTGTLLHFRVHDLQHEHNGTPYHDRYNRIFSLSTGWNEFRIPLMEVRSAALARQLNLSLIKGVGFFVCHEHSPRILYLDYLRLE